MVVIDDTRVLSKQLVYGTIAVIAPVGLIQLWLLTFVNSHPPHFHIVAQYFILISLLVILPVTLIIGTKYSPFKLISIVWLHLTLMAELIWFGDTIVAPYTVMWSILILFASIYYGWLGFIWSCIGLAATCAIYCILFIDEVVDPLPAIYIGQTVMMVLLTVFMSFLFVRIIMSVRSKNVELYNSHKVEKHRANELSALLNSMNSPVLTVGSGGKIASQNAASQVFFDTNESYVGHYIDDVLQLFGRDGARVKLSGYAMSIEHSLVRDDIIYHDGDKRRYLSLQIARIERTYGESSGGIVVTLRDITDEKTLEEEKDAFISVTSHELRTPIAIIEGGLGNLSLLRSKHIDDERFDRTLETAHKQITNLAQIVNDISMVSRAEQGVDEGVEEIDLYRLISELGEKFEKDAKNKGLEYKVDIAEDLPKFVASRLYLTEILKNLIKNAITYTKSGSVTVKVPHVKDGLATIEVTDTGIGISEADQEHVFEKFYRSEDYRTRETSGTGLGLYIVKMMSLKLGGKITLESSLNHGSTFRLVFPASLLRQKDDKSSQ